MTAKRGQIAFKDSISAIFFIIRNGHSIIFEGFIKNREIKGMTIVGNYILAFDKGFYFIPNFIKSGCIGGLSWGNSMNVNKPILIIIVGRLYQDIYFIDDFAALHPYKSNLTNTCTCALCSFKIDGCKFFYHYLCNLLNPESFLFCFGFVKLSHIPVKVCHSQIFLFIILFIIHHQ